MATVAALTILTPTMRASKSANRAARRGRLAVTWLIVAALMALLIGDYGGSALAASYPAYADMGSPQAVEMAERILSWQLPHGGWGKDLPIADSMWTPGTPRSLQRAGGVELGSFDNGATTTELRYLAHVYAATGESRFREAFIKGIDYILRAQYRTGGWPQVYPRRGDYADEVTFNDDAMVRVMQLLLDVSTGEAPFTFVDAERRAATRDAFERGIEYILKAQIEVGGRLTAWCAQHDPWTYEPKPGRSYEHPSISGSESVGIVRLLQSLPEPDERIQTAILSALLWLEEVRLPDGRWARFYEIGTNRPIFSGRDGVVRYDLAEVEAERREGYAWYGTWPQELLRQAWTHGWIRDLHAGLPTFETPMITVFNPLESALGEIKGEFAVDFVVDAHDPGAIRRITVSLDGIAIYDGSRPPSAGAIVVDTRSLTDGRHALEVSVEYGAGASVSRRRDFTVRNWWERRITMRAPEDQGWFGIVDHLGTSERSEGWEFLVDRSDPPFGVVFRLGWSGESSEHLVWPARGLREVELIVLSQAPTASGLRMEAGWTDPATGMSHWRPLEYTADFVRESADGWRLLRLVAQVGSASEQPTPLDFGGDMEWFRLSVLETEREGPLEIGDLRMRGIS